ncbi:ribonuclease H-like domain-containing protein [Tanacetum coccineum]
MLFTIPSWKQVNPPYKFKWTEKTVPVAKGSSKTTTEGYMENYKNVSQDIRDQPNAEAEAVQIILTGIDNDIYSIVDACPTACEMWKAIERLKQGESINVQDLETNLYWEFRKFTSWDGESLESYYLRSQQAATKNKGKEIVNSPPLTYDQEPDMVTEDDALSNEKEIDKLMALISLAFLKYDNQRADYVAGARENVGTRVVQQSRIQCYNCKEYKHVAWECQKPKRAKDEAYHKENMILCKQEEAGIQLNAEQAD